MLKLIYPVSDWSKKYTGNTLTVNSQHKEKQQSYLQACDRFIGHIPSFQWCSSSAFMWCLCDHIAGYHRQSVDSAVMTGNGTTVMQEVMKMWYTMTVFLAQQWLCRNKDKEEKCHWPFWEQKRSHPLDWCSSNEFWKWWKKVVTRKMDTKSTSNKPLQASMLQSMFEKFDILSMKKRGRHGPLSDFATGSSACLWA